mmetsp:Transcript_59877/g.193984  ORF Transcript_59877/g.193984 Transcript_59877/m.193984 type:complete len:204 (+) Transcript_59877:4835-5446(+)
MQCRAPRAALAAGDAEALAGGSEEGGRQRRGNGAHEDLQASVAPREVANGSTNSIVAPQLQLGGIQLHRQSVRRFRVALRQDAMQSVANDVLASSSCQLHDDGLRRTDTLAMKQKAASLPGVLGNRARLDFDEGRHVHVQTCVREGRLPGEGHNRFVAVRRLLDAGAAVQRGAEPVIPPWLEVRVVQQEHPPAVHEVDRMVHL